ncbi:MAG: NUDIX domain-containing protein [Clostridia bacterium]|nr:NUDIX domain-containing protein [Clostridia bacterium]
MDVKFWKDEGAFKLRVCGIIKKDNKYLISNCDNCSFWSYPGGHVTLGETTQNAVLREVYEETQIECSITKLLATVELFFERDDGKPFHEIGFYYLLSPTNNLPLSNFSIEENDNGKIRQHQFKWVEMEELETIDVRPSDLKSALKNNHERQHIIHIEKK